MAIQLQLRAVGPITTESLTIENEELRRENERLRGRVQDLENTFEARLAGILAIPLQALEESRAHQARMQTLIDSQATLITNLNGRVQQLEAGQPPQNPVAAPNGAPNPNLQLAPNEMEVLDMPHFPGGHGNGVVACINDLFSSLGRIFFRGSGNPRY